MHACKMIFIESLRLYKRCVKIYAVINQLVRITQFYKLILMAAAGHCSFAAAFTAGIIIVVIKFYISNFTHAVVNIYFCTCGNAEI